MRVFVITRIGRAIAQTEVGAQVDDPRGKRGIAFDVALGFAVRQRQEQHVTRLQAIAPDKPQCRLAAQVRVALVDERADAAFGRRLHHFDAGVGQQQTQQLAAGVTRRADNPNRQTSHA